MNRRSHSYGEDNKDGLNTKKSGVYVRRVSQTRVRKIYFIIVRDQGKQMEEHACEVIERMIGRQSQVEIEFVGVEV